MVAGASIGDVDGHEPFVGRETQVNALVSAVAAAEIGDGRVAFVGGEAGIGKTRLVTEVAARVACPVLWARCWPGNGAPAFWPWQQLLRAAVAGDAGLAASVRSDDEELGRLLGGAEAVGVTRGCAVPALRRRGGDVRQCRRGAAPSCWSSTISIGRTSHRCGCCSSWAAIHGRDG